jgi:hypothetical protein
MAYVKRISGIGFNILYPIISAITSGSLGTLVLEIECLVFLQDTCRFFPGNATHKYRKIEMLMFERL